MWFFVFKIFGLVVHLRVEVGHLSIFDCGVVFLNVLDCAVDLKKPVDGLVTPLLQGVYLLSMFKLVFERCVSENRPC